MLRAYRLIYLHSPSAPPTLWEWEQPWIHHLIVNARSFKTTRVLLALGKEQLMCRRRAA